MTEVEKTMWLDFVCHFRKLTMDKIDNYNGEPYALNMLNALIMEFKEDFTNEL